MILDNKGNAEAAVQPWDRKGFKIPGGRADHPKMAQVLMMAPTMTSARPPAARGMSRVCIRNRPGRISPRPPKISAMPLTQCNQACHVPRRRNAAWVR
mgnify:CR=1 FL=1